MDTTTSGASVRRRPKRLGIALAWLSGFILLALFVARFFIYEPFRIPSDSMYPTAPSGSLVLVDKRGFSNAGPLRKIKRTPTANIDRGEIVVFLVDDEGTVYVKRVIGLPGDHVKLSGRDLTINGGAVPVHVVPGEHVQVGRFEQQLATETIDGRQATIAWIPSRPSANFDGIVPEEHYFVLGDNRDNARDSRFPSIGFVSKDRMIGRVVWILKPGG